MKNRITILLAVLLSMQAFAADLIVRDGGAGGAFATITEAINAAVDGDRIIIRPKVGDTPYIEDVVIDKSLTLLSEINGDNYEISGSVTISVDLNRTVNIFNAFVTGNVDLNGVVSGGRAFVNIADSVSNGSLYLSLDNVTVNVVRTVCGTINFKHGKVIASTCSRIDLEDDLGDSLSTEDVYMIANRVTNEFIQGISLEVASSNYPFHMLNNSFNIGFRSEGTRINVVKAGSTNFIVNNYISSSDTPLDITTTSNATIVVRNNLFGNSPLSQVRAAGGTYVIVQHNMTSDDNFFTSNASVDENNIGNATFDNVTFTGDNVNAGHPDAIYTDIDLTQNDIGPKGGSYTQDNYFTGDNTTPYVFFLKTPPTIFNGTTNFEVTGSAKSN